MDGEVEDLAAAAAVSPTEEAAVAASPTEEAVAAAAAAAAVFLTEEVEVVEDFLADKVVGATDQSASGEEIVK